MFNRKLIKRIERLENIVANIEAATVLEFPRYENGVERKNKEKIFLAEIIRWLLNHFNLKPQFNREMVFKKVE